ncbi:hypothetical protein [Streptomyces sp. NPDC059092]|uniref:hypothetical protein n=1 Tax=Streptomyces sp. NPDC059092 TaxID=3346725 RepID=UPI0036761FE6
MPDLYDLFGDPVPEVKSSAPEPPKPGTVHTASVETIDNDRAGTLLGAVSI